MSISNNQENIEILFKALNKTKRRVNKLEKKTVGVNENEKFYNYDDSLERLFVITNGQTTRLDEIEQRINGIVSLLGINEVPELGDDHDQLINADNEHLNQSENGQPMGGRRTRGKLRARSRAKSRKKRRKKRRKSRRRKHRKKRTKRRK